MKTWLFSKAVYRIVCAGALVGIYVTSVYFVHLTHKPEPSPRAEPAPAIAHEPNVFEQAPLKPKPAAPKSPSGHAADAPLNHKPAAPQPPSGHAEEDPNSPSELANAPNPPSATEAGKSPNAEKALAQPEPPATPANASVPETVVAVPTPKIHHLAYATHGGSDDYFCRCLRLALLRKIPLRILGWGEEWKGLVQKWTSLEKVIQDIPDDDVLLFGDAYDVFYNTTSAEILSIFLSWKTDDKVVFMAEKGCWPQITYKNGEEVCNEHYPKSPTPFKYLNSGTWIGRKKVVVPLVKRMIAKIQTPKDNDQEIISNLYIEGDPLITLDYRCELFQSVHLNQAVLKTVGGVLHNPQTQTNPKIFHFNGGGKNALKGYEGQFLQTTSGSVKGSETFLTETAPKPLTAFCSDYPRIYT